MSLLTQKLKSHISGDSETNNLVSTCRTNGFATSLTLDLTNRRLLAVANDSGHSGNLFVQMSVVATIIRPITPNLYDGFHTD